MRGPPQEQEDPATVTADRPQMLVTEFEELARHAARTIEGARLEFINGHPYDSDTDRRDRVDKPRAYAETGIPVYLLIDRDTCELKVHSRPDGVRYETVQTLPFGKDAALPDPVGITLDTEPLKNRVR
jgi:hypothetical protein